MNRLFRSSSSTSSRSTIPEIPEDTRILNSESYEILDLDLNLGDWNIPKILANKIYKSSWSLKKAFKSDYHVKTIGQVYEINKEYETCYLFSPSTLTAHQKEGHNFLHIGLVQVGVKPLIREGLNCSILMALRDTRYIRIDDSLLGTIQTSLSSGLVHFNCYPNFIVSLHDPHIRKAFTLNIKTSRTLMVLGTKQLALIYRVYYKCIRTKLMFKPLTRKQKEKPPLSRP